MTRGINETNTVVSPAELQKYLAGAHYPVSKQDLVALAQNNGAPDEVVNIVENLPQDEFAGPQEVMKGYGQE